MTYALEILALGRLAREAPPLDARAQMKSPTIVASTAAKATHKYLWSFEGWISIIGVKTIMYTMKPISWFVVMAADTGIVFFMCWKVGKIQDRTTFIARPPQYA
jgi:hypothetical protein